MSNSDFEPLRRSALAMLADGNSLESVSQVLAVPIDVLSDWHAHAAPVGASTPPIPTAVQPRDEAAEPQPLSFDTTLEYSASTTFRLISLTLTVALGIFGYWATQVIFRSNLSQVERMAAAPAVVLPVFWAMTMSLTFAGRLLVLYPDAVVIPVYKTSLRMRYADVAAWSLAPHRAKLGPGISFKGQLLTIESRTPGRSPFTVFVFDACPIAPRLLRRLDEAVAANCRAAQRPTRASTAVRKPDASDLLPLLGVTIVMLIVLVRGWPGFSQSLHTLRRGTPPIAALRHLEGPVTGVSTCWTPSKRARGQQVMTVVVADRTGPVKVAAPCILGYEDLLHGGPHRLAVDLDPGADPPDLVYQLALDGRVLLGYDEVKTRQHAIEFMPALLGTLLPLGFIAFLLFVMYVSWKRSRPESEDA